jgi:hypothetical protein
MDGWITRNPGNPGILGILYSCNPVISWNPRNPGILESWNPGILESWNPGILES